MSQNFKVHGTTIWNPSNGVARVFVRQAEALEPIAGKKSGLRAVISDDTYEVDVPAMEDYVTALLEQYFRSRHTLYRMMVGGVLKTCLVLLDRAGSSVFEPASDEQREFARELAAHAQHMPR
jgi:Family of unknown function (DUF6086)